MSGRHGSHRRACGDLCDAVRRIAARHGLTGVELVLVLSEVTTDAARRVADEQADATSIIPTIRWPGR